MTHEQIVAKWEAFRAALGEGGDDLGWINFNGGTVQLDGHFTPADLRLLADAIDAANNAVQTEQNT